MRDKCLVVAGHILRKKFGKTIAIDLSIPWKDSSETHQYGLNTLDEVNMMVLMATDLLQQNVGLAAAAIDGQNVFKVIIG